MSTYSIKMFGVKGWVFGHVVQSLLGMPASCIKVTVWLVWVSASLFLIQQPANALPGDSSHGSTISVSATHVRDPDWVLSSWLLLGLALGSEPPDDLSPPTVCVYVCVYVFHIKKNENNSMIFFLDNVRGRCLAQWLTCHLGCPYPTWESLSLSSNSTLHYSFLQCALLELAGDGTNSLIPVPHLKD